jgi:hypothetical protein
MDTIVKYTEEKLCKELRDSIVMSGDTAYVKHIFVNTFYTSNPKVKTSENGRLNQLFRYKTTEYKDCLKQGDYQEILMLIERPWRLNWVYEFRELIKNNLGVDGFYEIVAEAYSDTENAFQNKSEVVELFNYGNQPQLMMDADEKTFFDQLPNQLKIYRGVYLNKRDDKYDFLGSSWTLDFEMAKWFSERRGFRENEYPLVYSLTVNKEDVLSYFSCRKESEILIDYTKIAVDEVEFIYVNELNKPVSI